MSNIMSKVIGNITQLAAMAWFVIRMVNEAEVRDNIMSILGMLLLLAIPVGLAWFLFNYKQFVPHAFIVLFFVVLIVSFFFGTDVHDVKNYIGWPLDWETVVWLAIIVVSFGFATKMVYTKSVETVDAEIVND